MGRGRPPKVPKKTHQCLNCKNECVETKFYSSESMFWKDTGKILYCKSCIEELYNFFCNKYREANIAFPEKKAVKRMCMILDVYYNDVAFDSVMKKIKEGSAKSIIATYMGMKHLSQYEGKYYDDTFLEDEKNGVLEQYVNIADDDLDSKVDPRIIKFFGSGFSKDDYEYLDREYKDWTARHECETKAQEEVFKRICFKQLEILKATRSGEDTKDLDATFQKLLETAKLQPKQNSGDTTADNQTFGTLIDKWENTRPIDEPEDKFKDVDNIGLYIDVFFRSHLAKMMGLKTGISNLYTNFMKKYTVSKPEYNDDENSEILFDAIFGNASDMKD